MDSELQIEQLKNSDDSLELFSLNNSIKMCKVVDVYDADTCHCVFYIDNKIHKFVCRLIGIDSPEIKPSKNIENRDKHVDAAIRSRNRLIQLLTNIDIVIDTPYKKKQIKNMMKNNTKLMYIKCGEFDKYGRLLVEIVEKQDDFDNVTINSILISEGHAKAYDGGKKSLWTFD
jgi:endonuclease YncB( thermonuclease family)